MDSYFLVTPPGLEAIAAAELSPYGIAGKPVVGGIEFSGGANELYTANYLSRVGVKVLARIGMPFYARSDNELGQKAMQLPWERWIVPGSSLEINVTCKRSKLMHSGMVMNIIRSAINKKLNISTLPEPDRGAAQLVVRVNQDLVTISIDSSGDPLYKRGYRQEVTRSPIRENLAAGLIIAANWRPERPLIDPFCGSGTIPIEAALMALGIAPGMNRTFAFMDWPSFDHDLFNSLCEKQKPVSRSINIYGYDRDEGAIEIAKRNAERAGVGEKITFKAQAISYLKNESKSGCIVTNPPYGERVSAGMDLRNLYSQLGNTIKREIPAWSITLITNDPVAAGHAGIKLNRILSTDNGGIRTEILSTNKV